jgi:nicotinate-nucleotide--dimethylbenzimidazole phosphoribosyltransferase
MNGETVLPRELPQRDSEIIGRAIAFHAGHLGDPLEALRRVGGRETAALAGAIVAARTQKVPVLLDGLAAVAAAAIVHAMNPSGVGHCMIADGESTPLPTSGQIGLEPVLMLGMETTDASAGAIAAGVVQGAAHCHAAAGASEMRNAGRRTG